MWDIETIQNRWKEAVDIERRMRVKGGPGSGNAWPSYRFDDEDRKGWTEEDRQEELDYWSRNKALATPEMTRWSEVFFEWTGLVREDRRSLVWRWAQCKANGGSFSEWCDRKGMNRRTAYLRLERVFSQLAAKFNKEGRRLVEAEGKWASQKSADELLDVVSDELGNAAGRKGLHPKAWRSEPSTDHLTSPEAMAAFEQHLAEVNERRHKARLRKALRGVPGEQEAA